MQTNTAKSKISDLALTAMMMCIIIVAIFLLRIPIPFSQGYVNLSDGVIFIAVLILDRKYAVTASALGSMMGDIIGGFAMWAPWTFVIKGCMALIAGLVIGALSSKETGTAAGTAARVSGMVCGGIFMVGGYFIAESIMYGSRAAALLGIPWNIGQFAVGIVLALAVSAGLQKAGIIDRGIKKKREENEID